MSVNTGPPTTCKHAVFAQAVLRRALVSQRVTPADIVGGVAVIDDLLRRLRQGRSRRNRYRDVRRRLRLLRALCRAAERFWSAG